MYDNTCKFLAESFSGDFASWLLGKPVTLTKLSPSELSLEPIRADALILLESTEIILHLEFQTEADPTMAFRMLDYRTRAYRRFPKKQMKQVVIYLTPTTSELVYQTTFDIPGTRHEFEVVRLWEQPTQLFLESAGLLPLAVLTQSSDKAQTLRQVASRANAIEDQRTFSNVVASAAILAGLSLEKELIYKVLRQDIMKQSVIYQDIQQESELRGALKESQSLVLRQLTRRIGEIPPEMRSQIEGLSLEQTEELGEALLDFTERADLENWLKRY
ncbi:MAG: Rpn family recombination-promoting nuclease/putative transposase [Acaryochloris sp. RU_4_1]|nr:Rpn family recombination-promoting nuclease/putative transposase [Acaryochloris sp. RU_4_1]